jgi:ribonucleoside-diphosphate reductase alpha chain
MGDYGIDWAELKETVKIGTRLLDNVVSVCTYPIDKIDAVVKSNRKIGLGVMGWADVLVKMGVVYGSEESLETGGKSDADDSKNRLGDQ